MDHVQRIALAGVINHYKQASEQEADNEKRQRLLVDIIGIDSGHNKQALMGAAKAVGGAFVDHAKSWIPRMWGGAAKFVGEGMKSTVPTTGKLRDAGNWLADNGQTWGDQGRQLLGNSRETLWKTLGPQTAAANRATKKYVTTQAKDFKKTNPGLNPTARQQADWLHAGRKAQGGAYNWGGKAMGIGAAGSVIGAGQLAGGVLDHIPLVGKPLGAATRLATLGPSELAFQGVPKLLDPGARYGAERGAEEAAFQMLQQYQNMPMMQRLIAGVNPQMMMQQLPPEMQQRFAQRMAQAQQTQ